ncbi:hydroxyproline O-galactosyltransferase HPGT1-like [Zingiber officinale]|uniref:hydroxyproline O-galactosyltransferase HPGT1-like n=1 Tax=Zingiber officinale TaxID=94328 RepID=UPI001C4D75EA|nr:hydroxyproline O-galactosyltransferase HPGT1-like [Zingiber officinale]
MQIRGSGSRPLPNSRISAVMLTMIATMASFYVAGRLWQDAQRRGYLIEELGRRIGQGKSAISVDETLKLVDCRQQHKKLAALEIELAAARHKGFVGEYSS